MKKRILLWMITVLVLLTAASCGEVPPATPPETNLTAFPAPCQTLPAGMATRPASGIPATGAGSPTPCGQVFLPAIAASGATPAACPAIQRGLAFLTARYNQDLGLLNEAPQAAPHAYWLTNDNALAAYAFARLGQAQTSAAIQQAILRYGSGSNGLIEVVWGEAVTFPPYAAVQARLQTIGEDEIYQEMHDGGPLLEDWAQYADLGFYGALNAFYRGDPSGARAIYAGALALYDGAGFRDAAFQGEYATYKLALALYAGAILQAENPDRAQMLATLLAMQDGSGGFRTEYNDQRAPGGDANTETSALALLALAAGGCALP